MGSRKKKGNQRHVQSVGLLWTREEVEQGFRKLVKTIHCPACNLEYTDFAVEWGDAWSEGRRDLMQEAELGQERDGPIKLKCELCGHKAWLNYFAGTAVSADMNNAEPESPIA